MKTPMISVPLEMTTMNIKMQEGSQKRSFPRFHYYNFNPRDVDTLYFAICPPDNGAALL